MVKRSVLRLDNDLQKTYSVRVPTGAGEIENGFIAKLGDVEVNNLEVRGISAPLAGEDFVIIGNPAVIYDNNRLGTGLENEYFMTEGQVVRAYEPEKHKLVSVSVEGFATVPTAGDFVGANGTYKLDVLASEPATGTYAKVVKLETVGGTLSVNVTQSATTYVILDIVRA